MKYVSAGTVSLPAPDWEERIQILKWNTQTFFSAVPSQQFPNLWWNYEACSTYTILVGGFNPFEKYGRQIGSFPQIGVNIKNVWNHQLDY